MGIVFLVICGLTVMMLYGIEPSFLFWLAIINTMLYIAIVLAIPNIMAISAMKKHEAKVEKMHQQGATDEQIELVLNAEVEVTKEDKQSVSTWLYIVGMINALVGVVLFIIGLIIYLF